jgi:hypothetical protein
VRLGRKTLAIEPAWSTWRVVPYRGRVITRLTTRSKRPHRDNSSVVPPTLSPMHSCSTFQSPQLENTSCLLPPLPLASDQLEFVDDISDIDDLNSDDDLSPVLDTITVSSKTVLSCILDIVYFNAFPFLTRLSQFLKTLSTSKFSGCKLRQNARLRYRSASLPMPTFERQC